MKTIESNLYTDPQAQKETALCPVCGRCVWAPSMLCVRCQRENP